MQVIDVGEPWSPSTDQQDEAARLVLKKVGEKKNVEIRSLMNDLRSIYDQKKDMKDLLKNLSRASNYPVVLQWKEMKIGRLKKRKSRVEK